MSSDLKSPSPINDNLRNNAYDLYSSTGGSLPLLVKMPDGERHQIDLPPNSSVRDLKVHIANLSSFNLATNENGNNTNNSNAASNNASASQAIPWDLDFAGSILNENHTLDHYHIPDAYDHANGLLKTISDGGYDDPDKKVEALDKAVTLVRGISRGERDMERLITSAFEDTDEMLTSPSAQPSLSSLRRSRRSRIPSLNFSHLAPIGAPPGNANAKGGDATKNNKSGLPSAPPTPSQLIRRLSNFRPDLYDPKVIDKVTGVMNTPSAPGTSDHQPQQSIQNPQTQKQESNQPAQHPQAIPPETKQELSVAAPIVPGSEATETVGGEVQDGGELKRGNTWFADVISSFGTKLPDDDGDESDDDGQNDIDGDSEGEEQDAPAQNQHQNGNTTSMQSGHTNSVNTRSEGGGDTRSDISRERRGASDSSGSASGTHQLNEASDTADERERGSGGNSEGRREGSTSNVNENRTRSLKMQHGKQVIGLEPEVSMSAPVETIRLPKRRGRKRKNPHLSEEERKAQRQAQNRESAKLSRIRRKNMTVEYEKRVSTLEGENENLRDTVTALQGRLEMLQNLLTISVQKRATPDNAIVHLASAQQQQQFSQTQQPQQSLNVLGMAQGGSMGGLGATGLNLTGLNSGGVGLTNTLGGTGQTMPPTSGALPNLDFDNL